MEETLSRIDVDPAVAPEVEFERESQNVQHGVSKLTMEIKSDFVYEMELRRRNAVIPVRETMDTFLVPGFDERTNQINVSKCIALPLTR